MAGKYLIIAVVIVLVVAALTLIPKNNSQMATTPSPAVTAAPTPLGTPIASVTYNCDARKTIAAVYYPNQVNLTLSDGRKMDIPQAMSGSGARYANSDESFVFWNKGNTAFITEGSDTNLTYANCNQTK